MDTISAVGVCVDRSLGKFEAYGERYTNSLDQLRSHVENLERELITTVEPQSNLSVTAVMIWEQCIKKLGDILRQMGAEHRDMHGGVSKTGKEIDKGFVSDLAGVSWKEECYESQPHSRCKINMLAAEHLLSQGYLDVAEILAKEAGVTLDGENKAIFNEMNLIMDDLATRNTDSALEYRLRNSARLRERDSYLEFSLHRLRFCTLLRGGGDKRAELLHYARNLERFADRHRRELQTLMGALLYLNSGVAASPYAHLLDDVHWAEISDMFARDACGLYGLPVNSPLSVILNAGTVALPALLNLRNVMQQRQVVGVWGQQSDELPIEIDLGPNRRYHSVFACPILRQQTNEQNPPMRLVCGHVISKDALHKLASSNRLKCPYCPVESIVSEARRVYF